MTTNFQLNDLAAKLKIKNYAGCFMKDELINKTENDLECGIVNLQNTDQNGSHWVCYFHDKTKNKKLFFDSFGLDAPIELQNYLGENILSSTFQIQELGTDTCGDLCILVLYLLDQNIEFEDVILNLE